MLPSDGEFTTEVKQLGFGDSIVAGYCGWYCREDSYAVHLARGLAERDNAKVVYQGRGQSGALMSEIADTVAAHTDLVNKADYITIEGCGNDYLEARDAYNAQSDCSDTTVLQTAMASCKQGMQRALDEIAAWAKPSAKVMVMTLYYPTVAEDRTKSCGSRTNFEGFLQILTASNWMTCNEAWKRGFACIDAMAAMNAADIDENGDQVAEYDKFRFKAEVDEGEIASYQQRVFSNAEFVADGHHKILDVSRIPADYLQEDSKHPSQHGHQRLALEHLKHLVGAELLP